MTEDWPLSFFNIKDGTNINLEFIQIIEKKDKKKKTADSTKKYLRSLGIYEIEESPENENLKEFYANLKCNKNKQLDLIKDPGASFSAEELKEVLIQVIKKLKIICLCNDYE